MFQNFKEFVTGIELPLHWVANESDHSLEYCPPSDIVGLTYPNTIRGRIRRIALDFRSSGKPWLGFSFLCVIPNLADFDGNVNYFGQLDRAFRWVEKRVSMLDAERATEVTA